MGDCVVRLPALRNMAPTGNVPGELSQRCSVVDLLFQAGKKDIYQLLGELPVRRYIRALRDRVQDLTRTLDTTAYADQYAGNTRPTCYSIWYNDIPFTTNRRGPDDTGYYSLAQLGSTSEFVLPSRKNWLIPRDGTFMWMETTVAAYVRYSRISSLVGPARVEVQTGDGGLFDPVFPNNGGGDVAMMFSNSGLVNNAFATQYATVEGFICGKLALYDKKRGRYLTDGQIPLEYYAGSPYGMKPRPAAVRLEPDTEIEARLFIQQTGVNATELIPDADDAEYNNTLFRMDLCVVANGYTVMDEMNSP